jgi:hypothetical protein
VSNARRLKPRPPDEVEAAFRRGLARGCPYCGSRRVVGRFHGGTSDYGLRCEPSCRTFAEPLLAHRIADQAARRAAEVTGLQLGSRAFDSCSGRVEGAVIGGRAGG